MAGGTNGAAEGVDAKGNEGGPRETRGGDGASTGGGSRGGAGIYGFLLGMWALIIAGGGIVVTVLGPISVSGYGDLDTAIASAIKAAVAVILVVLWVLVLSKLKNWIFRKEMRPSSPSRS